MSLILFALFIALPILELAVLIKVGGLIGVLPTILLLILSAVAGLSLMRMQGARALADLQRATAELRDPTPHLGHGALILIAGALMVMPGFLTDLVGLALLLPPVRSGVMAALGRWMRTRRSAAQYQSQPHRPGGGTIIDAEFIEIDDPPLRPARDEGPRDGRSPGPTQSGRLGGPRGSGWTRP